PTATCDADAASHGAWGPGAAWPLIGLAPVLGSQPSMDWSRNFSYSALPCRYSSLQPSRAAITSIDSGSAGAGRTGARPLTLPREGITASAVSSVSAAASAARAASAAARAASAARSSSSRRIRSWRQCCHTPASASAPAAASSRLSRRRMRSCKRNAANAVRVSRSAWAAGRSGSRARCWRVSKAPPRMRKRETSRKSVRVRGLKLSKASMTAARRVAVSSPRAGTAAAVARTVRARTAGMGPGRRLGDAMVAPRSEGTEGRAGEAAGVGRFGMRAFPFTNGKGTYYGIEVLVPIGIMAYTTIEDRSNQPEEGLLPVHGTAAQPRREGFVSRITVIVQPVHLPEPASVPVARLPCFVTLPPPSAELREARPHQRGHAAEHPRGRGGQPRGLGVQRAGLAVHQRPGVAHRHAFLRLLARDQREQRLAPGQPRIGAGAFLFLGAADLTHQDDPAGALILVEHRQQIGKAQP